MKNTISVELTREEIDQLAKWHGECEKRFADMREYGYAGEHKEQGRKFEGIQSSGWYRGNNG